MIIHTPISRNCATSANPPHHSSQDETAFPTPARLQSRCNKANHNRSRQLRLADLAAQHSTSVRSRNTHLPVYLQRSAILHARRESGSSPCAEFLAHVE